MRTIALVRVEHELGQRARELGLAHAGRAEEEERADRPVRVLQARARAAQRVGDRLDRLVLADHALVQALLHVHELLDLALHQPRDGDAGPLGHDLGDVLGVDVLLEEAGSSAVRRPRGLARVELLLELGDRPVADLGGALQVGRRARRARPRLGSSSCSLSSRDTADASFSRCHSAFIAGALLAELGELALERLASAPSRVGLLLSAGELDLELHDPAVDLVDLRRACESISMRSRDGGLVDEVDGLVGQEAVGDVAVRERRGGHERGVLDAHAVVDLVALLEPAEDRDGVLGRSARRRRRAGSGARAPGPSRCACGTRRAWWRRPRAARRARAWA